jgi:polyhydroxyalkanoate synthesis regulator phasin
MVGETVVDQLSMKLLLAIAEIIVLILLVAVSIKASIKTVPQKKRLIIYRLGRFHRCAGPGLVVMIPFLEQVVHTLEVHERPLEVTIPGVFAFGIPNDLTFYLACRFDSARAAAGDQEKLANLMEISESERYRQIEVGMRVALVHQIAELQKRMPLPDKARMTDGVVALAPGSERYNALLEGLKRELEKSLPTIGVILSTTHPIVITGRRISDDIIEAIKQRRRRILESESLTESVDNLRQQFPDMTNTSLAQILGSIAGIDKEIVEQILYEKSPKREKTSASPVGYKTSQDVEYEIIQTQILSLQQELLARVRHLGQLQLQEAKQGVDTPPHIKTEIREYKNKINELETRLAKLNA